MDPASRSKGLISFILCVSLVASLAFSMPDHSYAEAGAPATEADILETKTQEPEKGTESDGFVVTIKDKKIDKVSETEVAEETPSTESDKYYLVDTTAEALELASATAIQAVEPNYKRYSYAVYPPNDPDYSDSINYSSGEMVGPGKAYRDMGIDSLWKQDLHGEGVHVAVLDTGINAHRDMTAPQKILKSQKVYPSPINDSTINNDIDGHGTMVTSLIRAGFNNGLNIAGIADESNLTSINIFLQGSEGMYSNTWLAMNAYEYLLKDGNTPDVLNCSYGGSGSIDDAEGELLKQLVDKGCIVIAANGNDGNTTGTENNKISYPAAYPWVIGVGATDGNGVICGFSTKNSSVDVSAWGGGVAVLYGKNNYSTVGVNGTSFSSPIVAGIAACIKELNPELDSELFLELIKMTSTDKGYVGKDTSYGYGIINADKILDQLLFEISYETNGGTWEGDITPTQYTHSNSPIPLPMNISKENSEFKGWYMNADLTNGPYTSIPVGKAGDLHLYAKWGTTSAISFVTGNGSPIAAQTLAIGDDYGILPVPVKTGYNFAGWYLDKALTKKIEPDTTVGALDQNVYAKWTAKPQSISFNDRGKITAKTYLYDSNLSGLPLPGRTGYTFSGWYTASSGGTKVDQAAIVRSNMTLYARWTAKKYKIKFKVNGGRSIKTKSKIVTYDKAMGSLPVPKRKGYNFLGWKSKKSGGTKYSTTKTWKETKGRTLYANWTKRKIVKFNARGGSVSTYGKAVKKGKKYGTLPKPSRTGYTFKGWYTKKSGGKKITARTKVKTYKNHTLYARWKKK